MLGRVLLFGALLIALTTATGRAHASSSRWCSMLGRVDRVTRGLGMKLQVDLFVVDTSHNDSTMCLPRGLSTKVAVDAADWATVTRVRVGSWVGFMNSHDMSYPDPLGYSHSTYTTRLAIARPSDAARGQALLKQPVVEPAESARDAFRALALTGSRTVTLSGSAARDPGPASPRLIAKWATAGLTLTFANPLSARPTLAELRQVTRLSLEMPRVGELEARLPGWEVRADAPSDGGARSPLQTHLAEAGLARHFRVIAFEGDRLVADLEVPTKVWVSATNKGQACAQRYVEAECKASVGREISLRVRFELIVK